MNKLNQRIREHLGYAENEYVAAINGTVDIALAISLYAHRNQQRENDTPYYVHPFSCMTLYRNFVGIVEGKHDCIDLDLMDCYDIPFHGVQEVALLHDVLEDTDVTIDEIEEVFEEFGEKTYFNLYIKQALLLITHNKSESYEVYIDKLLGNPIASICKMMDLTDNMNMLGLRRLTDTELNRTIRYAKYFKQINDKWRFLTNVSLYRFACTKDKDWWDRIRKENPNLTAKEIERQAHLVDLSFDWD